MDLGVEFGGVRSTMQLPNEERAWEVLRFASEGASGLFSHHPHVGDEKRVGQGKSEAQRIRDVVAPILSDGDGHPRRELARAVRKAGLRATNLDSALNACFESYRNAADDPCYRDPGAPMPERGAHTRSGGRSQSRPRSTGRCKLSELDERQLANLLVLDLRARRIYAHEICGRCQAIEGDPLPPLRWETDVTLEIGPASARTGGTYDYLCPGCWWGIGPNVVRARHVSPRALAAT
jgi:hypothetical protein